MWARRTTGFTIVELLIVIVVIGILAAIVIVAYTGITNSARDSTIKSDLTNAKKKLMVYKVNNNTFPTNVTQLATAGISAAKNIYDTTANNFYYCRNTLTDEVAVGARTISNTAAYVLSSTSDPKKLTGVGGDEVCQAAGLSGYADTNGFIANGHANGAGWQSWIK